MRKLDNWLSTYLKFTAITEPPLLFREWVAISVIAAALQRKCFVSGPWAPEKLYPNMYIVLVAPSGKARKGTAMGSGQYFLRKLGVKIAAESLSRQALIEELATNTESSTSIEPGVGKLHSSLTVFSKELVVFLGYNNNEFLMDLVDLYDCHDIWTYRTIGRGAREIIGVWLNLIGATTPDLIRTALPQDAIGAGLTSRMIFVYEEKKGNIVPVSGMTEDLISMSNDLEHDLRDIYLLAGEFKVTDAYLERYIPWYIDQEKNPPFTGATLAPYVERRATHLRKLSLILSAARTNEKIIDVQDFERALTLLQRTEIKMPFAFRGVGRSPIAALLMTVLSMVKERGQIEYHEVLSKLHRDVDKDMLDRIVLTLKAARCIRDEVVAPDKYYLVHVKDIKE